MKDLIIEKMKKEIVFTISLFIAIITSFITIPKVSYIDFKVLCTLFNLMVVICALQKFKILDKAAIWVLSKYKSERKVSIVLVLITFISSMLITNDVSLITFVPITIIIAEMAEFNPAYIIILQTLAANIGSSLTPMGNPQNLFLFSFYKLTSTEFFQVTIGFVLLGALWILILNLKNKNTELHFKLKDIEINNVGQAILFSILFVVIVLSVFKIIRYEIAFIITIAITFITDKNLFRKVDYFLIGTFICFFILVGNLANLNIVRQCMSTILSNNYKVYISSIVLSQFISNVPSAILLSSFTSSWRQVLIGVNIGGMGTLIASLASVISYKYYASKYDGRDYLIKFHLYNFLSLFVFTIIFALFLKS